MITDGMGTLAAGACSLFGAHEMAANIMNDIGRDKSGEWYYNTVDFWGLDNYANPDGGAASVFKFLGNAGGMIGATIASGGIASGLAGAAVGGGLITAEAGAYITAGATAGLNAIVGAFTNAGSEAEFAMQNGASVTEAQVAALNASIIGAVSGGLTGKFSYLAKGSTGVASVIGYGLAAFAIGSGDPLLNEVSRTAIYQHDENLSFFENFMINASNDGLLLQMTMAGGIAAGSTVLSGLTLKNNNATTTTINEKIAQGERVTLKFEDIDNITQEFVDKIDNPKLVDIVFGDEKIKLSDIIIKGKVNKDFTKLPSDIPGISSLDSTAEMYSIKFLMDILTDEKSFNKFLELSSTDKIPQANAIKELMDAALKNKLDLGLSELELTRANKIISDYSKDVYLLAIEDIKAKFNSLDCFDAKVLAKNPELVLSEDFREVYKLLKLSAMEKYINASDEVREMFGFIKRWDILGSNNIINQGIDVGEENIDYLLNKMFGERSIDREFYRYLRDVASRYDLNNSNSSISKQVMHAFEVGFSWFEEDMFNKLYKEFGDYYEGGYYYDNDRNGLFQLLDETLKLDTQWAYNYYFKKSAGSIGSNDGHVSHINIGEIYRMGNEDNLLKSTITHESVHQISAETQFKQVTSNYINDLRKYGIEIDESWFGQSRGLNLLISYNGDKKINKKYFTGINESITEFLNKRIMGSLYPNGTCGYDDGVKIIDILVDQDILSVDVIKESYFDHDLRILFKPLEDLGLSKKEIGNMIINFDNVISIDDEKSNLGVSELNKIVSKLLESKMKG